MNVTLCVLYTFIINRRILGRSKRRLQETLLLGVGGILLTKGPGLEANFSAHIEEKMIK